MNETTTSRIAHYGSIAGSMATILGLLWLIGEPFLEDYVDSHIENYDAIQKESNTKKVKLRTLLSEKMGIDVDEVHIELGKTYKQDKKIIKKIDSLQTEIELNLESIKLNYQDINAINRKIESIQGSLQ